MNSKDSKTQTPIAADSVDTPFRDLIDRMPDGVVVVGTDGIIRFVNSAAEALLGHSATRLIGTPFGFPVPLRHASELDILRPEGDLRVAEMRTTEMHWKGEKVCVASLRDITDRKLLEKEEKEQRGFLETLLETIPSPVYYKDRHGTYLGCNRAFEDLLGVDRGEIVGKTAQQLASSAVAQKHRQKDEELFQNPSAKQVYEWKVSRPDESVRDVIFNKAVFFDERQEIAGLIGAILDITEHKLVEEEVREKDKKYRALFETMTQGVLYQNAQGEIIDANPAAGRILGLTLQEMLGRTSITSKWEAIREDGSAFLVEDHPSMIALRTGKEVRNTIMGVTRPRGEDKVWININSVPQFEPGDDRPRQVYTAFEDITERKRAEDELKLNQVRQESLVNILQRKFDSAQDLLDYALAKAIKLTGSKIGYIYHYNEESREFKLNTWSKEVMNECSIMEQQTLYQLDKTGLWGEAVRQRKPIVVNDYAASNPMKKGYPPGHAILRNFMTLPVFSYGRIVAVVGVGNKQSDYNQTDVGQLALLMDSVWQIVKRTRAEESLRRSEEEYHTLVENVPGAVFRCKIDEPWPVSHMSEGVLAVTGRPARDYLESRVHLAHIVAPEDFSYLVRSIQEGIHLKQPFEMEYRIRHSDGSIRWVHETGQCTYDQEGRPLHLDGVILDITTRKEFENQLREAKQAAEAAARAKSDFLANMSHEIRTPMTAIMGLVDMALTMNPNEQQKACLRTLREAADSLLQVINDILDLSKIEAGRLELMEEPFEPAALLQAVVNTFDFAARQKGIRLHHTILPGVPAGLIADASRLRQILMNLVGNALKFTEQGEVRLIVERNGQGEKDEDGKPSLELKFSIQDTGIGIPERLQDKLFESFTQADASTSKKYGGTGLGLAICKHLVEMMGGRIWFRSQEGQGSTFYFTARFLPHDLGIEAERPTQPSRAAPPVLRPLRILLAEDNEMNRLFLMHFLTDKGHTVRHAASGKEVLAVLQGGAFDLILMDVQMPEMDGMEATRRIRSGELPGVDSGIPIIALTAYAMKGDRERFLQTGMNDYVTKPVDVTQLFMSIDRALTRSEETYPLQDADGVIEEGVVELSILKADCSISPALSEVIQEAIGAFRTETPAKIEEIRQAIEENEMEQAARLAHRLVGSCGLVRATGMVHLAREIEEAARKRERMKALKAAASLKPMWQKTVEVLAREALWLMKTKL